MATKTKCDARRTYARVASVAESIRNAEPAAIPVMSAGDVVRQGDLYLVALDEAPEKASDFKGRQLALGTTQGSRHIAEGDCRLYMPDEVSASQILGRLVPATLGFEQFFGPVIVAEGLLTVTHPEHGHRTLPAGAYLVTTQRTWAQEVRRSAD